MVMYYECQYKDSIQISWSAPATRNDDGDLVPGEQVSFESPCRAEPNSKGQSVSSEDGTVIIPTYSVFMPVTTTLIPYGASAIVVKNGKIITATVKRFEPNTFNSRIWL